MPDGMGDHLTSETEPKQAMEVVHVGWSVVDCRVTPWSARTDAAVRWIGWHAAEIAMVAGTTVAGLVSHPLWWAVTVPAAVVWIAHEYTLRRRRTSAVTADASRVDAGQTRQDQDQNENDRNGRRDGRGGVVDGEVRRGGLA